MLSNLLSVTTEVEQVKFVELKRLQPWTSTLTAGFITAQRSATLRIQSYWK